MSQKDVWQKHMGPLKTQVGEADAATSLKTTREKVSPTEKATKGITGNRDGIFWSGSFWSHWLLHLNMLTQKEF